MQRQKEQRSPLLKDCGIFLSCATALVLTYRNGRGCVRIDGWHCRVWSTEGGQEGAGQWDMAMGSCMREQALPTLFAAFSGSLSTLSTLFMGR